MKQTWILRMRRWVLGLALCASAGAVPGADEQPAVSFAGTWRWTFTMPDGTTVKPRLKLKQAGEKLTGKSSLRTGSETEISEGRVEGEVIRFQVVRDNFGEPVVTKYTGRLTGKTITGKVESNWNGEVQTYDWVAERAHEGAEGTWKWSIPFGDRKIDSRVTLKQDGEKLTGKMPGFRGSPEIEVKHGKFKDGEVSFEVEFGRDETKFVSKYRGKQDGDTIKGTIESNFGGSERTIDWHATRGD